MFLGFLALTPAAFAQRTSDEWAAQHLRDASALRGAPRGALSLLRLRALREHVDPAPLADRLSAFSRSPGLPPLRRALATQLEAELRRDVGQGAEAAALSRSLGWVTRWLSIGPFPNEGRAGFAREMQPETTRTARLSADTPHQGIERPVRWRPLPASATDLGRVHLDAVVRPSVNACSFAHTTLTTAAASPSVVWLGATGAVALWVNGVELYRDEAVRRATPDRVGVPVTLRAGPNRVLLKLCTDDRGLGFYLRVTRPDGTPRTDLEPEPDPAAAPELTAAQLTAGRQPPRAPNPLGVLADLRRAASLPNAPAQTVEDYARLLYLTQADDPANPQAADLAERAARAQPSAPRWLLLADITTDRNRRLEALRRAYALAPTDPHVLAAVGHERRVGVRPEDSLPFLEEAIRRDPAFVLPRIELALATDSIGLPLAAHRSLEEIAGIAPRSAAMLRARVQLAERAGQSAVAERLRRALARVRLTDLENLEAMARDARQRGDRDGVRTLAERMVALRPEMLSTYSAAAELFESVGDGDRSVAVIASGLEMAPDEAGLWSTRANIEERLGHLDDARTSMRRALALRPQDATLRQHLEALEPAVPRPDEDAAEPSSVFLARRSNGIGAARDSYNVRSLAELTVRTVYENGLSGMFRQVVYEVRNDQGARDGRQFTMQYDPGSQRFELRGARVFHPDGSVNEGVQLEEFSVSSDPAARMYFTNRVAQVTFAHLSPGDVVELRWRTDDVSPRNAFADYFGDLQVVQAAIPRAHWQYVLRAPAQREYFIHVAPIVGGGGGEVRREESTRGEVRVHRFVADNVPAVPPEDHAPGMTERAAYLHVSTYRAWADVGRWYWGLIRDQLTADDRLRGVVQRITAGLTTDRDKVRAIYHWVIANTRYVALEFGIHGFKPYSVPQICTRGFGDCKDKASVIVTMLREAGIDASIVLLRTRANGRVTDEPASLAIFDHAIAYVPSLDLFLDGTAQHSGMDELPGGDQGVTALVVNQRGEARLMRTPVYTPDRNVTRVNSELTLNADGSAALRVTQDVRGPNAGGVRSTLEAEATRNERLEDDLRDNYPGVRVTAVRTGDLRDVEAPAHFEYEATVPTFGTRQGTELLIPPMSPLNLSRNYATRSSRTLDLVVGVPSTREETRVIRLPQGMTVGDVPPEAHVESPFGRFDLVVTHRGSAINVRRTLVLSQDRVSPTDYPRFRSFCQSVDDAVNRRINLWTAGGGPR